MKKILILIIWIGATFNIGVAQRNLNKEVDVRTNYQPKINKATRIGQLPNIVDTSKFVPSFKYIIQTRPLAVGFAPAKINAAKLNHKTQEEFFSHSLILAGGNYATLLGDYRFQSKPSKEFDLGVHLQHYSQKGKLEMSDNTKVKPNYVNQLLELFGTKYLEDINVGTKLFYHHTGSNYYGFRNKDITTDFEQLKTNNFGLTANFQTAYSNNEQLNFGGAIGYEYFGNKYNNKNNPIDHLKLPSKVSQNDITASANAELKRGEGFWQVTTKLNYFTTNNLNFANNYTTDNTRKTLVWHLNPQYLLQKGALNFKLGLNTILATGDNKESKIYPDIKVDFEAVPNFVHLYAGINGDLKMNKYKDIVTENRFIFPGLNVQPTNIKYNIFGGVRSNISDNIMVQLSAEYAKIDNQYFFNAGIIPSLTSATYIFAEHNKFNAVYDNISRFKLSASTNINLNKQFNLFGKVNIYAYNMSVLEKPFHQPTFETEVTANYKFNQQLSFSAGFNMVGKRWASATESLNSSYCLNVGANYDINTNISAFAKINNFFGGKYYRWEAYPAERLNVLLGIAIRF